MASAKRACSRDGGGTIAGRRPARRASRANTVTNTHRPANACTASSRARCGPSCANSACDATDAYAATISSAIVQCRAIVGEL
jgi:hypothetical protein